MDFAIDFESVQTNTQDRFQYTPVTFLPKKIQSIRPQIENHEIEHKGQIEMNKRGRREKLGIQRLQPQAIKPSTKYDTRTLRIHEELIYTKSKRFMCSS